MFSIFQRGLQKTKTALVRGVQSLFSDVERWDEASYARLEATLISTDLGPSVSRRIVADVRDKYERGLINTDADILDSARTLILDILCRDGIQPIRLNENGPTVILLVGVNGSGKTTSAAKLTYHFRKLGKTIVLGAGDTFRAAGVTQLQLWGERLDCPVIGAPQGSDSAAVAFDAIKSGIQKKADFVIIDTAGRQHTRTDLMDELLKVKRICGKALPGAPHEIWLTVDASIGSNSLVQAKEFGKVFPITGLILTKLDGSGKGGVVVAIKEELGYPVQFIGLGEQMGDLQLFDPEMFVKAMF
ncbi:MAG: signal recognition particle-docking protein FtsY [Oligosphaeraceae bacterium]|nr:signal recognition particle-docking protein FtsY [Oligosphaeraceae bacterium]